MAELKHSNKKVVSKYKPVEDFTENLLVLLSLEEDIELETVQRNHRTLCIIYGSNESEGNFTERVYRLVSCLNTSNTIKADIITVTGEKIYYGVNFLHEEIGNFDQEKLADIKEQFDQVIEIKNGK